LEPKNIKISAAQLLLTSVVGLSTAPASVRASRQAEGGRYKYDSSA